ncbi:MAG: hypothetical protein ACTSWQ_08840 [Candidatus Thorarchaeota archaeon]
MKCLNCGGEDFEKADRDGIFTLPYTGGMTTVEVPRYFKLWTRTSSTRP